MEQGPMKRQPELVGPAAFAANVFKLVGGIIDPVPHIRRIETEDHRAKEYENEVVIDLTERIDNMTHYQDIEAAKARHPSQRPL